MQSSTPRKASFFHSLVAASIKGASSLSDINAIITEHGQRLEGRQVVMVLAKLAKFSSMEPSAWLDEASAKRAAAAARPRMVQVKAKARRRRSGVKATAAGLLSPASRKAAAAVEDAFLDGTAWEGPMGSEADSDMSDEDLGMRNTAREGAPSWLTGLEEDDENDRRRSSSLSASSTETRPLSSQRWRDGSTVDVGTPLVQPPQREDNQQSRSVPRSRLAAISELGVTVQRAASLASTSRFEDLSTSVAAIAFMASLQATEGGNGFQRRARVGHLIEATARFLDSPGRTEQAGRQIEPRLLAELISTLVWAVGEIGYMPSEIWLNTIDTALGVGSPVGGRCDLGLLSLPELCRLANSRARLSPPSSSLLPEAIITASYDAMGALLDAREGGRQHDQSPDDFVSLVVGLSALASNAASQADTSVAHGTLATGVAVSLGGLSGLEAWTHRFCVVTAPLLSMYDGAGLTATISALAALGTRPSDDWIEPFYAAVITALQRGKRQRRLRIGVDRLSEVVWSLARLGCRPSSVWLNECLMMTSKGLPAAGSKHLAQVSEGV